MSCPVPSSGTYPGSKMKTCRPAEIGLGDFGCLPWAQSLLVVKGWSGKQKNFPGSSEPGKIFAALDGQLLLCDRPAPWPGLLIPFVPAVRSVTHSPAAAAPPGRFLCYAHVHTLRGYV